MSGNIIQLNEDLIKNNLKDLVRDSVDQKAYKHIEEWRQRPLTVEYPYVYVDGILIMVSLDDGKHVDSYDVSQLKKAW
ncbi:hypothetical protein FYJ78_03670 [Selenomonas sp. WCA-380-WT-3B 3/]|uniref:Uncharacterized protein n=1 Tax=Selenomonas montiformis TaxID=2652285 RepID=A0A6I2USW2_9FIRM|nr:hypothetical protein [Selenomonas montiformis]MSV24297.1 hypothetical protein [Selenomonas montiformis]